MSLDWPTVVLTLGAITASVVVWRESRLMRRQFDGSKLATLETSTELLARSGDGFDKRLAKIEAALRIDGQRVMAEAARGNLPAFMK